MDEISVSVRGLVEFICRNGDITGGEGSFNKEAMLAGSRIHRKIQGKMGINYQAEVPLSLNVIRSDYNLTIEGRADGILTEDDFVTIDEIKGVYKKLENLEAPLYVHKAQAMCYAYIYAKQHNLSEIGVCLTYCNLDTEHIKRFKETISFIELEKWFMEIVDSYCVFIQFEIDNRTQRNDSIYGLAFPYEYRPGQKDMAAMVYLSIRDKRNLFVQAPTGIGKTMAALFPAIQAMGNGYGEKLFYLTAKTIARSVALDGLNILRDKGLCFKSILITAKEKICPQDEVDCDPEKCPYAKGHYDRINDAIYDCITHENDITREVLLDYANRHMVCPFEMGLDVSLFVDGIICDYNYVFDPKVKLRRYFGEGVKGEYIFLTDEAHNLVDRASSMYSAQIYKEDFLNIKKIIKPYNSKIEKILSGCNKELLEIKKRCTDKYVIVTDISDLYLKLLRLHAHIESFMEESKEIGALKQYNDDILEFYFEINHFLNIYELVDDSYVMYGEIADDGRFMLKLFCIHTATNLSSCIEKGNATVFFSATMLPINYYKELLGDNEEDRAIYVPSPFPQKNRKILVGHDVSSRYKQRGPVMYEKIARYIDVMVRAKSGNYMAFFPSYKMLNDVYDKAMEMSLFEGYEVLKQDSYLSEQGREEFIEKFAGIDTPVLGFCILGGIFSEGIDLVGEKLIGAAVVGTGLPMVCNENEIKLNFFAQRENKGFEYAYLYPGMNKVQQAAGRVIRTMHDKGVILLLDERFITPQVVETFPSEWGDYTIVTLDTVADELTTFWDAIQ